MPDTKQATEIYSKALIQQAHSLKYHFRHCGMHLLLESLWNIVKTV